MKNFLPSALSWYLVRHYIKNFFLLFIGLLSIVYLFDTVELLRRAAKVEGVSLPLVLQMGLLKLPEVGQLIFPFAILFSAILSFWQLARRHELTILRASGLSVWQFIMPIILVALSIGILNVTMINPLGAMLVGKFETMESQYLDRTDSVITLSEQGLWLRQKHEGGKAILHSAQVKMPEWILDKVMVFFFSEDNEFQRRLDAQSAKLESGQWKFEQVVINQPQAIPEKSDFLLMATDLTANDLEESFSSPETISFWELPGFIKILEETGFDSTGLKVHFQNLLAQPLLFVAMILLAAAVSLQPPRIRGTSILIMTGILIGFVVFFASSFLQALGASQQIPIIIAAWFPAMISFLLGIGALMVSEDG